MREEPQQLQLRKREEEEKREKRAYIHCLLWASASDYPWSRTLTEHD